MRRAFFVVLLFWFVGVMGALTSVKAMPMFARKYGVACSHCHTTIPRLNETGYKFRAAGFRMQAVPSHRIGKPEEDNFELGNAFSARIQTRYDTQATNQP